ncbi:MAG: hypothetical protein Q4E54_03390 [Lachnospiraceae bacterium]|nr:hypothetical protein [Lachnospiraceae bacterium]
MQQGDFSAAVARFDEALSYHDGGYGSLEIDILRYRAEAEVLAKEYANAAGTYAQLRREDGERPEYINLEIICMLRAGQDPYKAQSLYEQSCALDPHGTGNQDALYALGTALSHTGKKEDIETVLELYKTALDDEKSASGELYNRIGSMEFARGEIDEAIDWFTRGIAFIQKNPDTDEADVLASLKYNTAICYEYKHDYETAKKLFEEYVQQYGNNEDIQHEIDFLDSRIRETEEKPQNQE